jgi:hypothetical protein
MLDGGSCPIPAVQYTVEIDSVGRKRTIQTVQKSRYSHQQAGEVSQHLFLPPAFLNWRAWNASEGAKYAAAVGTRTQQRSAAGALVEKLAGVDRHGFELCRAAGRAGNSGVEDHTQHLFGSQPRSALVPSGR